MVIGGGRYCMSFAPHSQHSRHFAQTQGAYTIEKKNERYMFGGTKTEAGTDREIPIAEKIVPSITKFYLQNSVNPLEIPEKLFYNEFYVALERFKTRPFKPHCRR